VQSGSFTAWASAGISILVACWRLIGSSYSIHEDRDAPQVASCRRFTKPVPLNLGSPPWTWDAASLLIKDGAHARAGAVESAVRRGS